MVNYYNTEKISMAPARRMTRLIGRRYHFLAFLCVFDSLLRFSFILFACYRLQLVETSPCVPRLRLFDQCAAATLVRIRIPSLRKPGASLSATRCELSAHDAIRSRVHCKMLCNIEIHCEVLLDLSATRGRVGALAPKV